MAEEFAAELFWHMFVFWLSVFLQPPFLSPTSKAVFICYQGEMNWCSKEKKGKEAAALLTWKTSEPVEIFKKNVCFCKLLIGILS